MLGSKTRTQAGHISGQELKFVLSNINSQLTAEEIEQLIKDADSDKDGLISYEGETQQLSYVRDS